MEFLAGELNPAEDSYLFWIFDQGREKWENGQGYSFRKMRPNPTGVQSNEMRESLTSPIKKKCSRFIFRASLFLFSGVVAIIVGGVLISLSENRRLMFPGPRITPPAQKPPVAVFSKLALPAFAEFKIEKSAISPSLPSYTLSHSEIVNLKEVEGSAKIRFSLSQLRALEDPGFFLQPVKPEISSGEEIIDPSHGGRIDDMIDLYKSFGGNPDRYYRKPENAVFVTSDLLMHVYHVFLDRTFQEIEENKFHPILKTLSRKLFENFSARYLEENNPWEKESYKRLTVFYLVPSVILESALTKPKQLDFSMFPEEAESFLESDSQADSPENIKGKLASFQAQIPAEIYDLALAELDLVLKAEGFTTSPLFGAVKAREGLTDLEDYSQYKPRSHYDKNSLLRTYFRAMMWYGRHGFDVESKALTRDALHMTWALNTLATDGQKLIDLWENVYLPTVFYVGRSDDLTVYDYSGLMKEVYGEGMRLEDLGNEEKLTQFQEKAKKLPGPKILSEIKYGEKIFEMTKKELLEETKGFRFMGQRFIPDSYIFAQLTQGDEKADLETGQKLPSTPTALMVMSIFGSETADKLLDDWIVKNAPDSDKVIKKVKDRLSTEFANFDEETWTQNIYWSWLYTLKPLFEKYGEGYPMFMKGLAWAKKSLQTVLGSWTELRHDTLLYAKQSYAEMGGGGREQPPLPPVPKGYVEPDLTFFERLIALVKMTREGFKNRNLLLPEQEGKLEKFSRSLEFLKSIVERELANKVISDDDYERLRLIGYELAPVLYPPAGQIMTERDARVGLIADVHTDALEGQILYEAIGTPSIIYVAVKDKGGTRLTRGTTYSYFEFTEPLTQRLTDVDWQGRIYEGKETEKIPSPPDWTKDLVIQ